MNSEIISPFLIPDKKVITPQSEKIFHQIREK
jgi:hypothetical protein